MLLGFFLFVGGGLSASKAVTNPRWNLAAGCRRGGGGGRRRCHGAGAGRCGRLGVQRVSRRGQSGHSVVKARHHLWRRGLGRKPSKADTGIWYLALASQGVCCLFLWGAPEA